ncbi:MAG: FAD:protein FMN transferase [Clostridium sp.]|nr:FAD:protein FMN transferase [Clostridiaceae bacterium]MDY5483668.1 FAD:protein FMN transferase [Clostridium sp.]
MTAVLLRPKKTEPISRSDFLLNTFVTVTLYDTEDESLLDSCMELCRMYESRFSKTISTSEIYQMNHRQPEETTFSLSQDTADLIREGLEYSRLSDGAFDITIEPLSSLWDFTSGEAVIPEESAIQAATARVDYRNLVLDGNTLTFLSPDTTIDLGSIAKGFIADRLKEYLVGQGVKSAIINLGGNVLCIGEQPDGSPFLIGLQAPFEERNTIYANLEIHDLSVVSSGVYERHFVVDGKNYHHLLNPKTGYPYDNGLISVTILSSRSVDGDALSTTCFSLGLDKGLALVNSLDGIDAFFMTEDKEVHYSDGAEAFLR